MFCTMSRLWASIVIMFITCRHRRAVQRAVQGREGSSVGGSTRGVGPMQPGRPGGGRAVAGCQPPSCRKASSAHLLAVCLAEVGAGDLDQAGELLHLQLVVGLRQVAHGRQQEGGRDRERTSAPRMLRRRSRRRLQKARGAGDLCRRLFKQLAQVCLPTFMAPLWPPAILPKASSTSWHQKIWFTSCRAKEGKRASGKGHAPCMSAQGIFPRCCAQTPGLPHRPPNPHLLPPPAHQDDLPRPVIHPPVARL